VLGQRAQVIAPAVAIGRRGQRIGQGLTGLTCGAFAGVLLFGGQAPGQ
jgi:hypothetical protein